MTSDAAIDRATALRLAGFFRTMWGFFIDGATIDGVDLMDALEKSGLTYWKPADAAMVAASDCGVEIGDPLMVLTDEAKAILKDGSECQIVEHR
jgi:hypothetical protein